MSFKIFGCEVKITLLFCALICMLLIFDASGTVPFVLISCALHESGHLIAMKISGVSPEKILLSPIGASISANLSMLDYTGQVFVAASGPAVNLLTAAFCAFFLGDKFRLMLFINLALGIFNLLPCASFDGAHILNSLLSAAFGITAADKICKTVSVITLTVAALLGVILFVRQRNNIMLLIVSSYMLVLEFSRLKY